MLSKVTQPGIWQSPLLFGFLALLIGGATGLITASLAAPPLVLVVFAGLLVTGATLVKPEWGLLALVVIAFSNLSDVAITYYDAPSIAQPFVVLLVLAIGARWVFTGRQPQGWQLPLVLIGAYSLIGFLSIFYAVDAERAQTAAIALFKHAIIAIIVVVLLQRGIWLRRVVWTLLGIGIVVGTVGVFQYMTGTFDNIYGGLALQPVVNVVDESTSSFRITGPIGDPNYFGQMLVVLLPLALDRLWNERSLFLRLMAGWSLMVCILAILFTFSRGAFLSMAVVLTLMLIRHPPNPIALLITLAVAISALQFVPDLYTDRISTLVEFIPGVGEQGIEADESLRGRTSEMIAAWQMFADHPVLGVGINNYNTRYQEYSRQLGLDVRRAARSAHSLYLEIAAEKGLVGLAAFGILLTVMYRGLWYAYRQFNQAGMGDYAGITIALGVAIIGFLVSAIFLHDAYPRVFWLLYGIALAIPGIARHEIAARAPGTVQ